METKLKAFFEEKRNQGSPLSESTKEAIEYGVKLHHKEMRKRRVALGALEWTAKIVWLILILEYLPEITEFLRMVKGGGQ